ncbi:MAG: MFS transporter [Nitrososphaeria archaeon]|nr:MFS transporter [Nitrososphaeria archaeon]NIN51724.1 MFS transporter [Nitrososphaeria archaeon]NIQ32218.1 MFS transporter [Nitrososphaeria archaeon]
MKETGNEGLIYSLTFTHFINDLYQNIMPPLLPLLTASLALSYLEGGILITSVTLISVILQPVIGHFAEARGQKKRLLVLGFTVLSCSVFLFSFSNTYYSFLGTALLIGLGLSFYHPLAMSSISDRYESSKGKALGIHGIGGAFGFFSGPLILNLFLYTIGWRQGFRVLFVATFLLSIFLLKRLKIFDEGYAEARGLIGNVASSIVFLGMYNAFFVVAFVGLMAFLPSFYVLKGIPLITSNFLFALVWSVGIIAQPIGGLLSDRFERKSLMILYSFLFIPSLFLFSLTSGVTALLMIIVASFTVRLITPGLIAYVSDLSREENRAYSIGLVWSMFQGSLAVGPILTGLLIDRQGFQGAFTSLTVVAMLGFFCLLPVYKKQET